MNLLRNVDPEWITALKDVRGDIKKIEKVLEGQEFNPSAENIFKSLHRPLSEISVVIFGQDPYPNSAHAMGLAFSVPPTIVPLPKTLANIFRELHEDIGCEIPTSGDLSPWADQGVALINRVLTVPPNQIGGHRRIGWQKITNEIAKTLGERGVIAILWGRKAQELEPFFEKKLIIAAPHPSPLSAFRGFFGSKPFSKTNQLLAANARRAIDWSLP